MLACYPQVAAQTSSPSISGSSSLPPPTNQWWDNNTGCRVLRNHGLQKTELPLAVHEPRVTDKDDDSAGQWMFLSPEDDGLPSVDHLASILRRCKLDRTHPSALLQLHSSMCCYGLDAIPSLSSLLTFVFANARCIPHAQQLFQRSTSRDEMAWNSLIAGYVRCGDAHRAFLLYEQIQHDDSVLTNASTFVSLLKVCAELKDLETGRRIHSHIARRDLVGKNAFIGSTLIGLYAKCGSLGEAQEVFDKLPLRDAVSWTTLIAGYYQQGYYKEVLNYYDQMQVEGVSPDAITFTWSLKACGRLGAIGKSQEIHAEILRQGLLEKDAFLGSTLVNVYAKCGRLDRVQEVFDRLPVRDVVAWTALIAGYVQQGQSEKALICFDRMQDEGISPDAITLVWILRACGRIGNTTKGQEIHTEVLRNGLLKRDVCIGPELVDMYAKCGLLEKAQEVSDDLPSRNVMSWTALISGYMQYGYSQEAVNCFNQMRLEGISPNTATYISCLKACGSLGAIDKGHELHNEIARRGLLETDHLVGTAVVHMYCKCCSLDRAQEVFNKLPFRDIISWNSLITGYAEHGYGEEALNCFELMQREDVSPDAFTYSSIFKACSSIGATDKGQEIHAQMAMKGFMERDLVVGTALVDMYSTFGILEKAQEVFDKLPVRDVVLWNALISGYAEHGPGEEALKCLEQMRLEGIQPDIITIVCSLKACASIGAIERGQEIHADIARNVELESDPIVSTALVDMYAKCGLFDKAHELFDKVSKRDVVSWNALIAGHAQVGETEDVFQLLEKMLGEDIQPNLSTFKSVLKACTHTGLTNKGQMYFDSMIDDYGIIPSLEHYTCMVDLLGRAGQLEKAISMILKMPICADLVLWHIVLAACQKWRNVQLGRTAFEHAVQLDETDPSIYVSMANIYSDAGMQEDAHKIEAMRLEKTCKK